MYFDANKIPRDETLNGFDICIVGAGAAGIAMATRLIASDKKVLLITSGSSSAVTQSPFDEAMYKGVLGPFMEKVDPQFLTRSRLRMYGGSTNHFKYWARPLDEADLKPRPGYRDASWPLDISELHRYYPDANATGNFGPFKYDDIAYWAASMRAGPFPALADDSLQNVIFHAQPDDNLNHFQRKYGPALEAATNVTVLFNSNVLTIQATDGRNHVTALRCASIAGFGPKRWFHVKARSYVLAQGGIEVVRLLKISGDLGNNVPGHLGRGFMVHPLFEQAGTVTFSAPVDELIRSFYGGRLMSLPCPSTNQTFSPAAANYHVEDRLIFDVWAALAPKPEVLSAMKIGNFRMMMRFPSPTFLTFSIAWEQLPNENSTITLDPAVTDEVFHQPVVRLDWNLLEQDKQTIQIALDLCRQYISARDSGAKFEVTTDVSGGPEHWTLDGSSNCLRTSEHHMGAARMSRTCDDGIVNQNLRLHSVDNLYITGSAVFPTAGYANPTLTIVALALRLADHLQEQLT
jgi:choline dehydrogenase-like flavoprotein